MTSASTGPASPKRSSFDLRTYVQTMYENYCKVTSDIQKSVSHLDNLMQRAASCETMLRELRGDEVALVQALVVHQGMVTPEQRSALEAAAQRA